MNWSDPAVIVAISGLISAVFAVLGSYFSTKNAAKKDALTLANEAIASLKARIDVYENEIKKLWNDYDALWNTLREEREEWNKQTKTFNDKIKELESYIAICECKGVDDHQYNNNK